MENNISKEEVKHIANLAKLPLTEEQLEKFTGQFQSILDLISKLNLLDTADTKPTFQVTGLTDVFRDDVVDESRTLSQTEALKNAKRTHNGFFVVKSVFD